MVPDELPVFTQDEVERRASAFLLQNLGREPAIPIDVDFLLESMDDVELDDKAALKDRHGVLGAVCKDLDSGQLTIYIDTDLMLSTTPEGWARYRMTVAEELAHLKLHREVINALESVDDFMSLHHHSQWRDVERNAKRFAAAILMPSKAFLREAEAEFTNIMEGVQRQGHQTTSFEAAEKWLRSRLARRFEVSQQTVGIRLTERPANVADKVRAAIDGGRDHFL